MRFSNRTSLGLGAKLGAMPTLAWACFASACLLASLLVAPDAAYAQQASPEVPAEVSNEVDRKEPLPEELLDVGIIEHRNAQLPLDLKFTAAGGKPITLAEVFDGTRPVILTMNYSDCPMLCSLQLNGLVDAIRKMPWQLGEEYRILTVSIDPAETPQRAKLTQQKYLRDYGRPSQPGGWSFVVSRDESKIKQVADTVGFGYTFLPDTKEYAHTAALMICTPDGRVSKYLYGVDYDPQTLRFSLLEAAEGKVGTPTEQFLLYCFHYDPEKGRYGPAAFRIMQVGGVFTLVVLGAGLSVFWFRERRRGKSKGLEARG